MTRRTLPLSLHPAVIERHMMEADASLGPLRDAVAAAREATEKAQRIAEATLANEMLTEPARHRKAREAAFTAIESVLRVLDKTTGEVARDIEHLKRLTAAPPAPKDAASVALGTEIRAAVKALPADERVATVRAAILAGDDAVATAVVHAPDMLTGMTIGELGMVRETWRRARYPAEVDRLERLDKALADANRAASAMMDFVSGLTDDALVRRAVESEKAAAEAAAG